MFPQLRKRTQTAMENNLCLGGQAQTVHSIQQELHSALTACREPDILGAVTALHDIARFGLTCGHQDNPKTTNVVVSHKDRSVTVMEDGKVVATGKAVVHGDEPLGEAVYSLQGSNREKGDLRWSGLGYGKSDREDMAGQLRRINAEPAVREEIRKRMHDGMTVVTTDGSHTEAHRVADFTIIEGFY